MCRSPGRRPPGTPAAARHSAPPGHRRPSADGTACRRASPGRADKAQREQQAPEHPRLPLCHWCPGPRSTADLRARPGRAEGPRGLRSPCTGGSRRRGRTRPPRPAGTTWRCSSCSGSPGRGQQRGPWRTERWASAGLQSGQATGRPWSPPQPPDLHGSLRASGDRRGLMVATAMQGTPACGMETGAPRRGWRAGGGAGRRAPTWGWPQSHCSPRSTKPFPHTGPPTRRSGSGALARQAVRGLSRNLSRSAWLHWLNLLGNTELRGRVCHQAGGGGGQDTPPGGGPRSGWTSLTRSWPP